MFTTKCTLQIHSETLKGLSDLTKARYDQRMLIKTMSKYPLNQEELKRDTM